MLVPPSFIPTRRHDRRVSQLNRCVKPTIHPSSILSIYIHPSFNSFLLDDKTSKTDKTDDYSKMYLSILHTHTQHTDTPYGGGTPAQY